MVKVVRKIRLEEEGNDVAYWLSRPPLERLRALDSMRRMYIKAYVAPGKQRLPRVYRVVKLNPFIGVEELVVNKRAAGRLHDLDDAARLEAGLRAKVKKKKKRE